MSAAVCMMESARKGAPTGPTRTPVATDNFNRAAPLGSNWAQVKSANGNMTINVAGTAAFAANSQPVGTEQLAAVWVGAGSFTNDQYAKAVIASTAPGPGGGNLGYNGGVFCRGQGSDGTHTRYGLSVDTANPRVTTLYKMVAGTFTILFSDSTPTWISGTDTMSIEAQGNTIRACKNDIAIGGSYTVTDSSIPTGGVGGICGGGTAGLEFDLDSWEAGNLS